MRERSIAGKYLRRTALGLGIALGIALAVLFVAQPNAPKFVRGAKPTGNYPNVFYPFLESIPISDGVTWIFTHPTTNSYRMWILNVNSGEYLGEVRNADPLAINASKQLLLCKGVPPRRHPMMAKFQAVINKVSGIGITAKKYETYWLLDLKSNKSTLLGHAAKPTMPSTAVASPSFSHVYLLERRKYDGADIYLIDLANKKIELESVPGWPQWWWNESEILYRIEDGGFGLFDAIKKTNRVLVSAEVLGEWLKANGIDVEAGKVGAFGVWNGKSYDFYLTDPLTKWQADKSFLGRLEKPEGKLSLVAKEFKFGWSDHLDPSGKFYIYSGRDNGVGSSAIYLRNLEDGEESTLVESDPNGNYFSIPNFSGDDVVFVRSNALWKVNLSGSNLVRLFPPQ